MKDITSTSFGLVIAYLLPGLALLYAIGLLEPHVGALFATFLGADSNFGLFLLVILLGLVAGLQITVFRSLLFEELTTNRLQAEDFTHLDSEDKLLAFRAAVDENYRYHQFWGGIALVVPVWYVVWLLKNAPNGLWSWVIFVVSLLVLESATVWAARVSYANYVARSKRIMKEG